MHSKKHFLMSKVVAILTACILVLGIISWFAKDTLFHNQAQTRSSQITSSSSQSSKIKSSSTTASYEPSQEEKDYLSQKFSELIAINPEGIAYIYAPGTQLDEPVAQTTDNYTYLTKTFDGQSVPYLGSVFMDPNNSKDFSDQLTWLFGHARGSQVPDHRMFNDVNFYSDQNYFDQHPYVVIETPSRKFYYEAVAMIIVPETTDFYRTSFDNDTAFKNQLDTIYNQASVKNSSIKINEKDKYMVLSTCREEDPTLRANLYLRQIPDSEMASFVAEHKDQLVYQPTR